LRAQGPSCLSLGRTSYPASPSLQWVPWASVPHLPAAACTATSVLCSAKTASALPGWFALRSLPVPCVHVSYLFPAFLRLTNGRTCCPLMPGLLVSRCPLSSGLFYTRRQETLPSSRTTPLSTCPVLRPRWCPYCFAISAGRTAAFRCTQSRRLSPLITAYPIDHNYTFFGVQSRSLRPRFPSASYTTSQ
jgi:hypothetical protein